MFIRLKIKGAKSGIVMGQARGFFIRKRQPWIWKFMFPKIPFKNVAFAWGDTIYTDLDLAKDLIVHEKTHLKQMRWSKTLGVFCILLYKFCRPYRRKMELEAHIAQAKYLKEQGQPFMHLAKHLSSPMYNIMTLPEAKAVLHLACE